MVDLAMPAVNFYSMLSGLGDTIQANRVAQAKKDALAQAAAPGADYRQSILGLAAAGDTQSAALLANLHNHDDTLKQQAIENARQTGNDTFTHNYQTQSLGIQQQAAKRADYEFEHTPDQFVPNPKADEPGEPKFIDQYAASAAASANSKPIPFETLGGTKFLIRQPNGSYAQVDPNAMGQPQQPVQSSPTVVGDAEGVARGLYAPPSAPGQRPPVQVADAQPANFASRFQGQSAAPAGGPPVTPVAAPPGSTPAAPETPQPDLSAVDPQTGRRENWLKSQSPDVQAYIKKVADYEIDPRTSSIKGGHREQIMSAVAQYDPTYDQNTFGVRAKAMKDFGTGPQGNSIRSFDVGISHLDTLQKYVVALGSGDVRAINQIRNAWLAETGSALPTNVQAVAPIVGAEVSKAIIGSNNALADREELRKPLQIANSPEQIAGAAGAYKELMAGQLKGLKKQYEDTTGKKNFDSRIRDDTRKVLLGKDEASGSQPNVTSTGVKWSVQ